MGSRSVRGDYDVRRDPTDDPDDPRFRSPRNRSRRKDTKRWCRGKEGVEHDLVLTRFHDLACRPRTAVGGQKVEWWCFHRPRCRVCGKFLRFVDPADCPDRKADAWGLA